MVTINVEIPDRLNAELEELIRDGLFRNQSEILRFAALDYVKRRKLEVIEQQQRDDVAWALAQGKRQNTTR